MCIFFPANTCLAGLWGGTHCGNVGCETEGRSSATDCNSLIMSLLFEIKVNLEYLFGLVCFMRGCMVLIAHHSECIPF